MKVLLIWEMLPTKMDGYLIENPTEEQLAILLAANGTLIGSDDMTKEMGILNNALSERLEWCDDLIDKKWACLWSECKVDFPVSGPIDLVVRSGFIC